jgi:8-oxo-dGTP pyrophosphatase MutT (NUDIX family)
VTLDQTNAAVIWRKSASVIVAARNPVPTSSFDYTVCLLKRSMETRYMPGAVVFPGGLAEDSDKLHPSEPDSYLFERCADRELREETGITLPHGPSSLLHLCDWKTPDYVARKNMPKGGYETRFFVALLDSVPTNGVGPDGEEISSLYWKTPSDALQDPLPFPQQHLLTQLSRCTSFLDLSNTVIGLKKGIYRYQFKPLAFFGDQNGYFLPGDHQHDVYRPPGGRKWQHRAYVESLNQLADFIVSDELVTAAELGSSTDTDWCTEASNNSKL